MPSADMQSVPSSEYKSMCPWPQVYTTIRVRVYHNIAIDMVLSSNSDSAIDIRTYLTNKLFNVNVRVTNRRTYILLNVL